MTLALLIVLIILLIVLLYFGIYYYYNTYKEQELREFINMNEFINGDNSYKFSLNEDLMLKVSINNIQNDKITNYQPKQAKFSLGKLFWEIDGDKNILYKKGNTLIGEDSEGKTTLKILVHTR